MIRLNEGRILSIRPTMLAYYIMVSVTIFNTNKYHASMAFILYPVIFAFGLCLVKFQCTMHRLKHYILLFLICVSTILSTALSDVVGWSMAVNSFLIFSILYVLLTIGNYNDYEIRSILRFYAYIVLFLSIWLFVNLICSYNFVNGRVSVSIFGVRKDENYLSSYMTFGFFYFFISYLLGNKKFRYLLYSGLIFISVFMTGSRGALVAMLAGISITIIKIIFQNGIGIRSWLMTAGIVLFISIVYVLLSETSLFLRMSDLEGYTENIRLIIWGHAIEGFLRRPWIGSGIQSGTYFAQIHVRWYTHSCFVDLITSVGIIGALLYVWQYISYCKVKTENLLFMIGLLITFFVPLMFINGFETATFWIPMAVCKLISDYCKHEDFRNLLL